MLLTGLGAQLWIVWCLQGRQQIGHTLCGLSFLEGFNMLRYFVAWNFWLAFTLTLLLARGYVPRSDGQVFTLFGVGFIEPPLFWSSLVAAGIATVACVVGWRASARPAT